MGKNEKWIGGTFSTHKLTLAPPGAAHLRGQKKFTVIFCRANYKESDFQILKYFTESFFC